VDFEYEEHKIRMRTLAVQHETAIVQKKIAEKQLQILEEEYANKKNNFQFVMADQ
jgi:hypothetical protein